MEVYVDNALVISTNNSSFSISTQVGKGIHTVTIKAYDASNNVVVINKTVKQVLLKKVVPSAIHVMNDALDPALHC